MGKELLVRKNIRLQGYDYSSAGYYFITICVKDRHEMLGGITNGKQVLSQYGFIIQQEIENISVIRKECSIKKFVIMPNHLHLIVQIVGNDGNRSTEMLANCGNNRAANCGNSRADYHPPLQKSISNMVQGLKGAVTRRIGFSLWQPRFHDHIIRNKEDYQRIWQYIENNPAKWAEDRYFV